MEEAMRRINKATRRRKAFAMAEGAVWFTLAFGIMVGYLARHLQ